MGHRRRGAGTPPREDEPLVKFGWAAPGGSPRDTRVVTVGPGRRRRPEAEARPHPCATCGACCRTYVVPVCGRDVWRIARHLHLDPAEFVVAWREDDPGDDRFRIDPDGPLYSLVLDKRGWARDQAWCLFLMRLPGGQDRCGIYDHRPVACHAYPMVHRLGAVEMRESPLCPPDAWPADEARRPGWRAALQRARMQFDVYRVVVDHWNGWLRARPPGLAATLPDYYRYLMRVYDRLGELEAEIGPAGLAGLEAGWRAPLTGAGAVEAIPWQRHLDRVRARLTEADPPGPDGAPGASA